MTFPNISADSCNVTALPCDNLEQGISLAGAVIAAGLVILCSNPRFIYKTVESLRQYGTVPKTFEVFSKATQIIVSVKIPVDSLPMGGFVPSSVMSCFSLLAFLY